MEKNFKKEKNKVKIIDKFYYLHLVRLIITFHVYVKYDINFSNIFFPLLTFSVNGSQNSTMILRMVRCF